MKIKLTIDNAGDYHLAICPDAGNAWAHTYRDAEKLAEDLRLIHGGANPIDEGWDGHEDDALNDVRHPIETDKVFEHDQDDLIDLPDKLDDYIGNYSAEELANALRRDV